MKFNILFLAFLLPVVSFGQEFSAPLRVNTNTPGADNAPIMHVGPNGTIYVSWIKVAALNTVGNVYFSRSVENGRVFLPEVAVTSSAKISPTFQRAAPFAVDTKGNIHMVWMETRTNSQPDIWYSRSDDDGNTWTVPVSVSDDSSLYAQDFSSIACDSSGNVYISYIDSRDRGRGTSANEQLYMVKSTDQGMTWSPAKKVNNMPAGIGGTCECCKQDIQAGTNGHVTIAFRTNINDRRDVFVARSNDFGETFAEATPLQSQPWVLSACPVTGPSSFLTDDGTLYSVWRDNRDASGGATHVYLQRQFANNTVYDDNSFDQLDETMPNWPDIAVSSGVEAIVYETADKGLKYILHSPYELPYYNNTQVHYNGNKQQFGGVEFGANNERYIVWQENRSGTTDIYFTKDTMPVNFSAVKNSRHSSMIISPNPVRRGEKLSVSMDASSEYKDYELINIIGRVAAKGQVQIQGTTSCITIPEIPSGSYFIRFSSRGHSYTSMVEVSP